MQNKITTVSRAFTVLVFGLIAVAILSRADFHRSDTECHLSASANFYYYTTFCINVDSDECKKTRKFALRDIVVEYLTGVLNGKMYTMHMLERASIDLIAKALHGMFDTDGTNDVAFVQDCMRYIRKRISKKLIMKV